MEIKGIDVSSYQGNIDWGTVADYGMDFAILRITEKGNKNDPTFERNYLGCQKYGIPVGVYKYSYAKTVAQAEAEAAAVLKVLDGRKLDLPVFYDLEWSEQRALGVSTIEKITLAFLNKIKEAGYLAGIYCNADWYENVLSAELKEHDCWIARYPANDNGELQERLRPVYGVGWQYSSKAVIPGIPTKVDRDVFYKDYETEKEEENETMAKSIVQQVIDDAVDFAIRIANDNTHGYSQQVRSLYNIDTPKSFDCSSLVCTAFYYAFVKNGLAKAASYMKANCSYTGNMLRMLNCGFEVVARNQTAHAQMVKGDVELNTTYHTALAIDKDNIVHARSSEGTTDTKDNSGNEIRTQPWYLYSHGWTHRLRFTGKGLGIEGETIESGASAGAGAGTLSKDVKWYGVVNASELNVRTGAGTENANLTSYPTIKKGKEVGVCDTVKDRDGDPWYYIAIDGEKGKKYGFVSADYISEKTTAPDVTEENTELSKTPQWVGKVTASVLNVRTWAGTNNPAIKSWPKLAKGNLVDVCDTVTAADGSRWYYVRINGKVYGFVHSAYIAKI